MHTRSVPAVAALTRIRGVLDRIGDALVSGQLQDLLQAEIELAQALPDALRASAEAEDGRALIDEIGRARAALVRCRRLGASLDGVIGDRAATLGAVAYAPEGQPRRSRRGAEAPPAFEARA
jgi:hypothetical protein